MISYLRLPGRHPWTVGCYVGANIQWPSVLSLVHHGTRADGKSALPKIGISVACPGPMLGWEVSCVGLVATEMGGEWHTFLRPACPECPNIPRITTTTPIQMWSVWRIERLVSVAECVWRLSELPVVVRQWCSAHTPGWDNHIGFSFRNNNQGSKINQNKLILINFLFTKSPLSFASFKGSLFFKPTKTY